MAKAGTNTFGAAVAIWVALAVPALAQTNQVSVGIFGSTSDAPIFIADKKGYFGEEGISVKLESFQSAAMMVPPLGTGQLDIGAGSASAGLYNAVTRGIKIKIVAEKASSPPGYGATKIVVRKDHIESGRYKSLSDLKGMKFGMSAPGVANTATLYYALRSVGLRYADVETVNFSRAMDHVAALKNKSVDASSSVEPVPTVAVRDGVGVVVARDDEVAPNHQTAVLLYSEGFMTNRPELARKFMRAYVRAIRFYNGALQDGHLAGPNAAELIAILMEYTAVKDPAIYRSLTPPGMNPDGKVNVKSLGDDLEFYTQQGLIQGHIDFDQLVDMSLVRSVVAELGPYGR